MASRLYNIINAIMNPFGKRLWSGTWTSGTKTIPGASKYCLFLITMQGNFPIVGAYDFDRDRVYGLGGTFSGTDIYTGGATFTCSGDDWTLAPQSLENLIHRNGQGHPGVIAMTISGVYGLVPRWGGVLKELVLPRCSAPERGCC